MIWSILIGLAVFWLSSKLVPRGMSWLMERVVPSDPAKAEARFAAEAEKFESLKQRAWINAVAARKLRKDYLKQLSSLRSVMASRNTERKGLPPEFWAEVQEAQVATQRDLEALEARMTDRGWLARGSSARQRGDQSSYNMETLVEDVLSCLFGASFIGLMAAIPIGIWLIISIVQAIANHPDAPPVGEMIGFPLTMALGYLVAALGTALSLFLLRPLRRWFIGWPLSGSAIAVAIYGGIGLAGTLTYIWFDINIFDFDASDNPWNLLLGISGIMAVLGLPVGVYFWFNEGRSEAASGTIETP